MEETNHTKIEINRYKFMIKKLEKDGIEGLSDYDREKGRTVEEVLVILKEGLKYFEEKDDRNKKDDA